MINVVCLGANNPETVRFFRTLEKKYKVQGFIDNDPEKWGKEFYGSKIFGGVDKVKELSTKGNLFVNLITRDCVTRHFTTDEVLQHGGRFCNLVHPNVSLDMVKIGIGSYIQESVILQAQTSLGNNVSISMGSLVGHETTVGNSVFIAPGCSICGVVSIGDGVFIGAGATILPRLSIGKWSIIGAGAVVTKDVKPFTVVVGNPARIIRKLNSKEILSKCKLLEF